MLKIKFIILTWQSYGQVEVTSFDMLAVSWFECLLTENVNAVSVDLAVNISLGQRRLTKSKKWAIPNTYCSITFNFPNDVCSTERFISGTVGAQGKYNGCYTVI